MKSNWMILLFISAAFLFNSIPSYADNNAYGKYDDDVKESFESTYSWDKDKITADTWTGENGKEYKSLDWGYQKDAFNDAMDALIAQLQDQDYELDLTEGEYSSTRSSSAGIVSVALGEVGKSESPAGSNNISYNTWFYGKEVSGKSYEWCATFICWCANQCGYIDSGLFTKTDSCARLYKHLTSSEGFESYKISNLSLLGGEYSPNPGDLVFWVKGGSFIHMGIITDTTDTSISITQGNCSDSVVTLTYTKEDIRSGEGLYGGFVIHVEYPGFSFDASSGDIQDTVFLFLTEEMGMNAAAACGVMGNLQVECGWNINAVGDGGTSYGLCQWHNERWQALLSFCSSNGYDHASLEGQLRFLQHELETSESGVLSSLTSVSLNEGGARNAALYFAKQYERCTSASYSARQQYASSFYSMYGNR